MMETIAGHLPARQIERPSQTKPDLRQRQENYNLGETEDLESEYEFGDEDDMGELSDSYSTVHTSSRPVTPSHPPSTPVHIANSNSSSSSSKNDIFKLADKAEKILGLTPGTLAYARANLENARDQVRRTATIPSPEPVPLSFSPPAGEDAEHKSYFDMDGKSKKKSKMGRARKAMSVTGFAGLGQGKIAGVVVGAGGKEEEERRERRRKATDGVLYWQREVARLMEEDEGVFESLKKRR
ncbi:hypothetical protein IAR50_000748 [Cryptococcus sp. DSM 104548]